MCRRCECIFQESLVCPVYWTNLHLSVGSRSNLFWEVGTLLRARFHWVAWGQHLSSPSRTSSELWPFLHTMKLGHQLARSLPYRVSIRHSSLGNFHSKVEVHLLEGIAQRFCSWPQPNVALLSQVSQFTKHYFKFLVDVVWTQWRCSCCGITYSLRDRLRDLIPGSTKRFDLSPFMTNEF